MKRSILSILGFALLHGMAAAQDDIPLLLPEEQQAVNAQSDEFNQSLEPSLAEASKSTVRIWAGKYRLAYGTVINDGGKILTKWSEVARINRNLSAEASGGEVRPVRIIGVYEDEDLAVLEIQGAPLKPVKWSSNVPALGAFLTAPQPDGQPAAFGVVSVLERNLRDTDQAFLGVAGAMDYDGPGVKIQEATEGFGAAAAGIKTGDIILKVGTRTISGLLELKNSLVGTKPGSKISLLVKSNGVEKTFEVMLENRPKLPNMLGARLQQMEAMGGPISRVRDSFTHAIQTDMRPQPDQIGGPVVDLQGRVVGITMARADRTRSFVMPSAAVEELLKKEAQNPALAQVRRADEMAAVPVRERATPQRMQSANPERMRRHLSEMQRLMEYLQEEMNAMESQR